MDEVQAVTGASVAEIEQVIRVYQQDDRNFLSSLLRLSDSPRKAISTSATKRSSGQWRLFAGEWQEQERRDASELRRPLAELASLRKQNQEVGLLPARDLDRIDRWKQRVSPGMGAPLRDAKRVGGYARRLSSSLSKTARWK